MIRVVDALPAGETCRRVAVRWRFALLDTSVGMDLGLGIVLVGRPRFRKCCSGFFFFALFGLRLEIQIGRRP